MKLKQIRKGKTLCMNCKHPLHDDLWCPHCHAKFEEIKDNSDSRVDEALNEDLCEYCGGLKKIRNPTGKCDHLYYPDNVNKSLHEIENK